MSRSGTLVLLGVLTLLTPFSGLPSSWRTVLIVLFGFSITAIGFWIRLENVRASRAEVKPLESVSEDTSTASSVPHGVSPI